MNPTTLDVYVFYDVDATLFVAPLVQGQISIPNVLSPISSLLAPISLTLFIKRPLRYIVDLPFPPHSHLWIFCYILINMVPLQKAVPLVTHARQKANEFPLGLKIRTMLPLNLCWLISRWSLTPLLAKKLSFYKSCLDSIRSSPK